MNYMKKKNVKNDNDLAICNKIVYILMIFSQWRMRMGRGKGRVWDRV